MKRFSLILIVAIVLPCLAHAQERWPNQQNEVTPRYEYTKTTALIGAAEAVTVQSSATANKIHMLRVAVYCSVDCVVEMERNGTAATTTAGVAIERNPQGPAATASVFRSSNAGNTTGVLWPIPAGGWLVMDLSDIYLLRASTAENITFRTDAITGTVTINPMWEEYE